MSDWRNVAMSILSTFYNSYFDTAIIHLIIHNPLQWLSKRTQEYKHERFLSCQDQNNIQHPEVHSNDM